MRLSPLVCMLAILSVMTPISQVSAANCPALIGQTVWDPSYAVEVIGTHAYLSEITRLVVIDINDPVSPIPTGEAALPGGPCSLRASGGFLYAACADATLRIFDISEPSTPILTASFELDSSPKALEVSGSRAYVGHFYGVQIIDLTNPTHPSELALAETELPVEALAIRNDTLYAASTLVPEGPGKTGAVTGEALGNLVVLDISTPASPQIAASIDFQEVEFFYGLAVAGEHLLIGDGSSLRVLSLAEPLNPSEIASLEIPSFGQSVAIDGDFAYIPAGPNGLIVVDVSQPSAPSVATTVELQGSPVDVSLTAGFAWVAAEAGDLRVVDISEPASAVEIGDYDSLDWSVDLTVHANHAFVLDGDVQVFDLSDPARPVQVASQLTPGHAQDIAVADDLAFVADGEGGLRILDISDPASISEIGSLTASIDNAYRLSVIGSTVYLIDFSRGLMTIDVSDPTSPEELVRFRGEPDRFGGNLVYFTDLSISGSIASIAVWQGGLWTVDISNPENPIDLDLKGDLTNIRSVATSGDQVFVTDLGDLHVFTRAPSGIPEFVTQIAIPGDPSTVDRLVVAGHLLFSTPGMTILDISDNSNPIQVATSGEERDRAVAHVAGRTAYLIGHGFALADISACGDILPYTTWIEIAAHNEGVGDSNWRTDLVAHNSSANPANVEVVFHHDSGTNTAPSVIESNVQAVFTDIVDLIMGHDAKGSLEIRADQPLSTSARIYTLDEDGATYGQFLAGHPVGSGLDEGESAWLHQLRQDENRYRSNISITNGGLIPATVRIVLYTTNAEQLTSFLVNVAPGSVVQDMEPFKNRAFQPSLGWGFARVEVVTGHEVFCSASVIDSRTNDPTTISMVRTF